LCVEEVKEGKAGYVDEDVIKEMKQGRDVGRRKQSGSLRKRARMDRAA
jgi:hypothetical protein